MAEIKLSDGQIARVDDEDLAACLEHKWTAVGRDRRHVMTYVPGRGPRGGKRTCLYLHQFIARRMGLRVPPGYEIDHKDRDPLNNRRNNLRPATVGQQRANQGARRDNALGIKGVCFEKKSGRYRAEKYHGEFAATI